MTPRALMGHALFVVLAFAFAWYEGNHVEEKEGGPTSVTLLDAKKGEVVKLAYTWPKGTSTVESRGKEATRAVAMTVSRELDAPKKDAKDAKKDAGADAGPAEATPAPAREEAKFPGGKSVTTTLEAFEPLKSKRTFGDVDADRLKAMGLDKPERTVTATTASGKSVTLEIGEASYGGQGRYARVKGEKTVHLLESAVVTGLEGGAETLMEKRIVPANVEDIEGYSARYGDKTGEFPQLDREQAAKRKFVPKDDKTSTSEAPGKLMTTLRNLRATKVADPKSAGSTVATLSIDIAGRDRPQKIEILERTDGEGHLVLTDGWLFEISETQSKELLDDLAALWP